MEENVVLKARRYRNLTQQELADIVGTDRTRITKLESDKANPTIARLSKIASAMDMTLKIEFIPNEEIESDKKKL